MPHLRFRLQKMGQDNKENRVSSQPEAYNLLAALFGLFLGGTQGKECKWAKLPKGLSKYLHDCAQSTVNK